MRRGQRGGATKPFDLFAQVMSSEAKADLRREQVTVLEVRNVEVGGDLSSRCRHHLRQPEGPGRRYGILIEEALLAHQSEEQEGRNAFRRRRRRGLGREPGRVDEGEERRGRVRRACQ
jgi:hypothetical protein